VFAFATGAARFADVGAPSGSSAAGGGQLSATRRRLRRPRITPGRDAASDPGRHATRSVHALPTALYRRRRCSRC